MVHVPGERVFPGVRQTGHNYVPHVPVRLGRGPVQGAPGRGRRINDVAKISLQSPGSGGVLEYKISIVVFIVNINLSMLVTCPPPKAVERMWLLCGRVAA